MSTSTVRYFNRRFIVFAVCCACCAIASGQSQWTTSSSNTNNIYNSNTGNVGIGTSTPQTLLDVNGLLAVGGGAANLGQTQVAAALSNLQGSAKMVLGWNATGGKGESDFVTNTLSTLPGGFFFWNYNSSGALTDLFNITSSGNIGIGTQAPAAQFESYIPTLSSASTGSVEMGRFSTSTPNYATLRFTENRFTASPGWQTASTRIQSWIDVTPQAYIDFNPNGGGAGVAFGAANTEAMRILPGGNVLIGKTSQTNTGYLLDINGNARANEVVVNTTGADYVLGPGYRLNTLHDLESYITKEHHLPGIAPAAEMQQAGLNLGDNQTQLLAKIEELTLYLIQQDKETQALKEKIKTLEERNRTLESLEQRIERLERRDATTIQ